MLGVGELGSTFNVKLEQIGLITTCYGVYESCRDDHATLHNKSKPVLLFVSKESEFGND